MEETDIRTDIYEVGYHITPTVGDEGAISVVQSIHELVAKLGGIEIAEGAPERMDLAYPVTQIIDNKKATYTESYFGWYKFEAPVTAVPELNTFFTSNVAFIRHLLFKTVRENTYIPRKSPRKRSERTAEVSLDELATEEVVSDDVVADVEAESAPFDALLVDKKIDEMNNE